MVPIDKQRNDRCGYPGVAWVALCVALLALGNAGQASARGEQAEAPVKTEAPVKAETPVKAEAPVKASAPESKPGTAAAGKSWQSILESRHPDERARDVYRHPAQTLSFFGIRSDMTVVELWPGAGWYSRVLAPYLSPHGTLYAAHFQEAATGPNAKYIQKRLREYREWMKQDPDARSVRVTALSKGHYKIAPEGSADMVLTFRNVHNWMQYGYLDEVIGAAHRALKPGGVFGVVEHRAPKGRTLKDQIKSGYVDEQYVIDRAVRAGFSLLARSEINANPKDSADHPDGVWSLPPSLRTTRNKKGAESDHQKYLRIGESDRFTLKFVKH